MDWMVTFEHNDFEVEGGWAWSLGLLPWIFHF